MLRVLTLGESEEWDKIIKKFSDFDVYYLSEYVKAFHVHGDGEPLLFYYEDLNIKAINVTMRRDIKDVPVFSKIEDEEIFDLCTPYGYGGFIIEGDIELNSTNNLDDLYTEYCNNNNIISEFVRYHPVLSNKKSTENMYECIDLGKTITVPLKSKEEIWKTISGKNRNVIRKAIKSGVKIYWGRGKELIDQFIPLYNKTMTKDNATNYYFFEEQFYESILNDLNYNHLIFYAVYEEKIISMSIILFANKQAHYHLSASNRDYQRLSATNLLLFEVACWCAENNFETLHLGGGLGSEEDNLFKFKESFNKNSQTIFSIGKKIFDKEKYDNLSSLNVNNNKEILRSTFFPLYRAE